jgi:hypothetical protein
MRQQCEQKDSTPGCVRRGPYSSVVSLDDRAADRWPHAHAFGLARVNASKRWSKLSGVSPGPESCTATSTLSNASAALVISSSRDPSTPLIASTALMIKFSSTCCSWTRSPRMGGRSCASWSCNATRFLSSSLRARAVASRIVSLMSNGSRRGGTLLMRERIRPITSSARRPSLMIRPSACRISPRSGGCLSSQREAACALVTTAIGCLTSCAIEAVRCPMVVTRLACASAIAPRAM